MLLSHMIRCFVFVWIVDAIVCLQVDKLNESEVLELADVPTPFNVMLMTNEDDRYNQTTSLLVKWDVNEGKPDYFFYINIYSTAQKFQCSSYLIDNDFDTVKTLEYIAGPPDCTLTPSTLYNATVQIESRVDSPTLGNESLPSNNQATVPDEVDILDVYEIKQKDRVGSGIIFVRWVKQRGGDEIDYFYITCPLEACSLETQYISGTSFYQQNTTELTHGIQVNIAVSAKNSEGATSTLPRVIYLEPHPVVNLTVELYEEDPTKYMDLFWDTIGAGDNVLITFSSNENSENYIAPFSNTSMRFEGKPGSNYSFVLTVNSNVLSSQPRSIMITTKPSAPLFNVTPTSMTSMKVEWQPVEGSIDYYTIELGNEDVFPKVVVNKTEASYEYQDLLPYAEYNVYVYSVVIDQDGNEVKSPSQPQNILIYYEEFCEEEQLEHPGDKELVTFPRTKAGYSNTTLETCSSESANDGTPYGKRSCTINAKWNPPVWISSCETTLQNLTEVNITNNEEREEVASDLTVLTSNSSSLSSDSIQQSASVLESIVDTEELDQNTTTLVIESLGNLLAAPEEELQESEVQNSLLATLDEVTAKVTLSQGEEYQSTTSDLAIAVAQIDTNASVFSGIGYQENKNPSPDNLGFSEGQFQTFTNPALKDQNSTSIYLPASVVSKSEDGRVSFYAFADNKIFQVSQTSSSNAEDDVIEYDATIQSKIILSASIQGPDQNLTENVTITFEYNQYSCPNDDNDDSCGEYLCGFWDEEQSVWSQSGCILTRKSENVIECQCNHLTNFANLFAYSGLTSDLLDILTYVCCSISLLGSLLTIICLIYVRFTNSPVISNTTTHIMINLASALTLLNGFLLISNLNEVIENKDACTAIAVLLHFSLFATLLWTTVEAAYVCLGICAPIYYRTSVSRRKTFLYTGFVGWGIPFIFVGLTAGITKLSWYGKTNEPTQICWITLDQVINIVIIPASIIIGINTILYFVTIVTYFRRKQVGSKERVKISTGKSIIFSLSLFVIFGISWIFGFLLFDSNEASKVFAYIFTIATGLQGLFIFLLFVVRNKKVANVVQLKLISLQSDLLLTKSSTIPLFSENEKQSKPSSSNSYPELFTLSSKTPDVEQKTYL